jgi:hypothetical protein
VEHIRAVLSQCGVAMELHDHPHDDGAGGVTSAPITLELIRPAELAAYQTELAKSNPDYRHAVMGQIAVMYANRIFSHVPAITVNQSAWTYNASEDMYTREN